MVDGLFRPITDLSRPDIVANHLRGLLGDGKLSEGQQLVEASLVSGFGVSRNTIREALQRLIQEGLVVSIPHRGVFVREISSGDVEDIYQARGIVETAAALRLASQLPSPVLDEMRDAHQRMSGALKHMNDRELTEADQHFHDVLLSSLESERIAQMATTLRIETRLCLTRLEGRYLSPQEAADEHLAIIEAIESKDPVSIIDSVETHMNNAVALLLQELKHEEAAAQ